MNMELSTAIPEAEVKAFKYRIQKEISAENNSIVYLAENTSDSKVYYLELFIKQGAQGFLNDLTLSKIKHDSILQLKENVNIDEILFDNKEDEEVCKKLKLEKGIVMEAATKCNLLDLIQQFKMLPQVVVRSYTGQLVDALGYLHNQRIAHRDLKLDNIFLDQEYCLKLGGFATSSIFPKDIMCSERTGAARCLAPETLSGSDYDPFAADIFTLGATVFGLLFGYSPFGAASPDDDFYSLIVDENWEEFWSLHEEISLNNPILARPCLREFFERLLCPTPERRATIPEIKDLEWMKLPILDRMQVGSWIIEIAKKQKNDLLLSSL